MKIFLTESEVLELAYDALDMIQPDPDKVHNIALRMDMVYCEKLDMYEDVEEVSLRKYKRKISELQKIQILPSPANCNHQWYTDLAGTVAIRRCIKCTAITDALPAHLWETK